MLFVLLSLQIASPVLQSMSYILEGKTSIVGRLADLTKLITTGLLRMKKSYYVIRKNVI